MAIPRNLGNLAQGADTSGVLGPSKGGTGVTAVGTAGNVLTSDGTAWTSAPAGAALSGVTQSTTPFETSLGFEAGNSTTGVHNVFVGYQAGKANTIGENNVAIGSRALISATTGTYGTVAIGNLTLTTNTTGGGVGCGDQVLKINTTGFANAAFGAGAMINNTTGYINTAIGNDCLNNNSTGNINCGLGYNALGSCTSGSANIEIYTGGVRLFNVTTQSNRIMIGDGSATDAYVKVSWTVTSDARDKTNIVEIPHGLDFVNQLSPKQYQFKVSREDNTPTGKIRYGFLAQDILALEGNNPVIIDNEQEEHLKYQGESLVPVLVKALQELNAKFDAYVLAHP